MSSHFPETFHSYFVKEKAFFLQEKITTCRLLGSACHSLVKFYYISHYEEFYRNMSVVALWHEIKLFNFLKTSHNYKCSIAITP